MKTIYAKTPKGQQEIDQRSAGLPPRARRLLILLDGKRAARDVAPLVNDSQFDETLGLLVEQGYAEPLAPVRSSSRPRPAPAEAPAAAAVEAAPASPDEMRRAEMARNFMLNSLNAFYGPFEQLSLKNRIQQSRGLDELRALLDDWSRSIHENRAARGRAEEMKGKLLAVL